MVFSGVREEGEEGEEMEMGSERSSKPLHNFALPRTLKWGNQRHLRCMKVQDSSTKETETETAAAAVDQPPVRRLSSPSRLSGISEARRRREKTLLLSKPRTDGGVGGGDEEEEEGIEAVREKIMNDLKFAADKMKDAIFREEVSDYEKEKEKEDSTVLPAAALAAAATAAQESATPWNLRNRRAAGKSLIGGQASTGFFKFEAKKPTSSSSPMRSEAAGGAKSPRVLRGGGGAEKDVKIEWPKFSLTLTKKEIEEDFLKMTNHRPPRRPKRRPKNVQKQLDTLFPGTWLPDVTPDSYKVPESAENSKK